MVLPRSFCDVASLWGLLASAAEACTEAVKDLDSTGIYDVIPNGRSFLYGLADGTRRGVSIKKSGSCNRRIVHNGSQGYLRVRMELRYVYWMPWVHDFFPHNPPRSRGFHDRRFAFRQRGEAGSVYPARPTALGGAGPQIGETGQTAVTISSPLIRRLSTITRVPKVYATPWSRLGPIPSLSCEFQLHIWKNTGPWRG